MKNIFSANMKLSKFSLGLFFLCAILFTSCKQPENNLKNSDNYVYKTIQLAKVNSSHKTLINVINSGDCLTCIAVGKTWFRILESNKSSPINVVFVLQEMSDLKMRDLFKERFPPESFTSIDSLNIVRNNDIYTNLQNHFNSYPQYSFLLIVENDSTVIFNKKFKDPKFLKEVSKFIQ